MLVGPKIAKEDTYMRDAIGASERLTLTIHYHMVKANSPYHLPTALRDLLYPALSETCAAIWEALQEVYLRPPQNRNDWKAICKGFNDMWNFPHCLGAIDGKHIAVQCPLKSGSQF